MDEQNNKHSSVSKSFEIDQAAIKIFSSWLPNSWLVRKLDPDVFVDYLVEIVLGGEPTGKQFAAQIKGFEPDPKREKALSYPFKTKHLKYYLYQCQQPVFLFLINVTTREGFWLFAQKYLKEKVNQNLLDDQQSLTIPFSPDDCLLNDVKFKALLPEAEKYVRDLHPGSVPAALGKRKAELESKDPRCLVSISLQDGKEHIMVTAKENFSFTAKIQSKNMEGWRNFFERGAKVKFEPGEVEIVGAPLLNEIHKEPGGYATIEFGSPGPASIQIVLGSGDDFPMLQVDAQIRTGTKFMTFEGVLPNSPLTIQGEIPLDAESRQNSLPSRIDFSLDKWNGQQVMLLAYFDQIEPLVKALAQGTVAKIRILIQGNLLWKGELRDYDPKGIQNVSHLVEWLRKCRSLAQHFQVNPRLTPLQEISDENWEAVDAIYDLLQNKEIIIPAPGLTRTGISSESPPPGALFEDKGGTLAQDAPGLQFEIFGMTLNVGPVRHFFTEMKGSWNTLENGSVEYTFKGTNNTKRIIKLLASQHDKS